MRYRLEGHPYNSQTSYTNSRANKFDNNAMGNLWWMHPHTVNDPYNRENQLALPYISHSLTFAK